MPHFENSYATRGAPIVSSSVTRDFTARDHLSWDDLRVIRRQWQGNLVIKGEKHQEKTEKSENHYLSERSYGTFQRVFGLPPGTDESKIEAQFHNGVLTVTVPKNAEAPNARKVDVKAA